MLDERFFEVNQRLDGIATDVGIVKSDVSVVKADVSSLKRDMTIVREGLGILLNRRPQ